MKSLKRRKFTDKAARWVIRFSGATTVFIVLALFLFIYREVHPLLEDAKVTQKNSFQLRDTAISVGVDEYQEIAFVIYSNGGIEFISLPDGKIVKKHDLSDIGNSTITSVSRNNDRFVLGTDNGKIITVFIDFSVSFETGERVISPVISEKGVELIDEQIRNKKAKPNTIHAIASGKTENANVTIVLTQDGRLLYKATEIKRSLFGQEEKKEYKKDITNLIMNPKLATRSKDFIALASHEQSNGTESPGKYDNKKKITALALDQFTENLYVGTSSGEVFHIDLKNRVNPVFMEKLRASDGTITSLGFLLGGVSLIVGDSLGEVSVWMETRDERSPSGWTLKKVHTFQPHNARILAVSSSSRNKCFITADAEGTIHLSHSTSEQKLLSLNLEAGTVPTAITFSPKADGIMAVDSHGNLVQWGISNPHPEVTLHTLFGKVWYEGYEEPEYIWQSSGGTDNFEPKFGLVPLIFGTIKGTVYALVFAVPISIFAALYTSQFLHNSLKFIKPVIEILAALPSVIIGFLAALWLAPLIEKIFPAIVILPFMILVFIISAVFIWKILPVFGKGAYRYGTEALVLTPFIIVAVLISIYLGGPFESFAFHGDYRQWFLKALGMEYDQRNALVVGFAMGFAIIPIIFTISEDAMSNVPHSLVSASLALGATPWQTAIKIVLPTASPAIFTAVMIGFGRAVGETMIVLMATGNTPVMDWNLFNGFRALAANIAVEIPEAPVGGTLYRVLFLAALLLFIATFIVNTAAELIRQRMKRKYSKL